MTQGVDAESETSGEFLLGHTELRTNEPNVDHGRDVNPIRALFRLTTRIGNCVLEAATDTASYLAHFVPPYVSTKSFVSRRKSFRSLWLKSARSFRRSAPLQWRFFVFRTAGLQARIMIHERTWRSAVRKSNQYSTDGM